MMIATTGHSVAERGEEPGIHNHDLGKKILGVSPA